MYEGNPRHIWPSDDSTPELEEVLTATGRLIDLRDPALREILQAAFDLGAQLGAAEELDEDAVRMAIRLGRARYERMLQGTEPPRTRVNANESLAGSVYYIRRGAMVKIGTTVDLKARMSALLPEEVLAVEPGSYTREQEMHRKFLHLRVPGQREWFYAGRELQEHVEEVLDKHGPPPADLPTLPATTGILEA